MNLPQPLWLIVNDASGSNSSAALKDLQAHLADAGFEVMRTIRFPAEDLPRPADLEKADIDLIAIFTGDGTLNAAITALKGWGGAVLPLPGGTMNLLSKRLHAGSTVPEILARAADGTVTRFRPTVVSTSQGNALVDLLAGPGTSWGTVREAMRDADVKGVITGASEAITETSEGPRVHLADPSIGRDDGYPLIEITPTSKGLRVAGFYADTVGELLAQGAALLRHSFRDGPHDTFEFFDSITIVQPEGSAFDMLVDGEMVSGTASELFELAKCPVDLLATAYDD